MHPREGWTEDIRPELLTRRGFLRQGAAAGLLLGGGSSLLAACSSSAKPGTTPTGTQTLTSGGIPLPRPANPEDLDALARRAREFLEVVTRGLQAGGARS